MKNGSGDWGDWGDWRLKTGETTAAPIKFSSAVFQAQRAPNAKLDMKMKGIKKWQAVLQVAQVAAATICKAGQTEMLHSGRKT